MFYDDDLNQLYPTVQELQGKIKSKSAYIVGSTYHMRMAALAVFFLFALGICALVYVPWVQTVQGKGRVIAYMPSERYQNVDSPIDGRIEKWYVKEGDRVSEGDLVCDLQDLDPMKLVRLKKSKEAEVDKLDFLRRQLHFAERNSRRQQSLRDKGIVSSRSYELAEIDVAKFKVEIAKVQSEILKLETQISQQASQKLRAARDGTMMRIYKAQGGVIVKKGEILASLVPDNTSRSVELTVSGRDMPLLAKGRKVRLQFQGWPALQFSGWPDVAIGTYGGVVSVIDPSDDGYGNFRIVVFPDTEDEEWPEDRYLRQGVRCVGWILLDTVSLGYELWRQFNGFPPVPKDMVENYAKEKSGEK